MRPHRSSARSLARALLAAVLCAAPLTARAQGGVSPEGALFVLVPVGARAVGIGQADVASDIGGESIWANPAGLARLTKIEISINHSQNVIATGDALNVVVPAGKAGVIGATAYLVNYGQQDNTDGTDNTVIGTIYLRSYVIAASYAATFGSRVSAGVTYKFIQERVDCTGACVNVAAFSASTNGLDLGVQAVVDPARRLTLGLALRDAGLSLQVNDAPQSDPLPTRIHLGAQYLVPNIERSIPDGELRVSAELVENSSFGAATFRAGAELAFKKLFYVRGGFASGSGDGASAAIGLGVKRGGIAMDFARGFGGFSSDAGKPPTYLTLRFQF